MATLGASSASPVTDTPPALAGAHKLNWQEATIKAIASDTPRVKSFLFAPASPFAFRAGQHVDVRLTAPDGYQAERSYSIASAPERTDGIELAIERLDDGEVSPFFHEVAEIGDTIELPDYQVFLTPRSAETKGLAVVAQDARGFTIQEAQGGTGSYGFDWRVVGKRKDLPKDHRLATFVEPKLEPIPDVPSPEETRRRVREAVPDAVRLLEQSGSPAAEPAPRITPPPAPPAEVQPGPTPPRR